MLTQYKTASRWSALATLALVLGLGAFTFTSAAHKSPTKPAEVAPPPPDAAKKQAAMELRAQMIERRLAQQQDRVRGIQSDLNDLRVKLQILDDDGLGAKRFQELWAETLRTLEARRIEAQAEYRRSEVLYRSLTNLSRTELKAAIVTVVPDPVLNTLMDQKNTAEQKLAEILQSKSPQHPEAQAVDKVLEQIHRQIDTRLDGMVSGLRTKMESERDRLVDAQDRIEQQKKRLLQSILDRRPYEELKRELQRQQNLLDQLESLKLQQEISALSGKPE